MTTKTKPNIYQRLNACMKDVGYVQKQQKSGMMYTFASHDDVTRACRVPFIEHGVFVESSVKEWTVDGNRVNLTLSVSFVNIDNPEDRVCVDSIGFGIDKQDKGPGKAISYAYKYALLKCLALETGDDPETSNVDHEPEESKEDLYRRLVAECDPAPREGINLAIGSYLQVKDPKEWTAEDLQDVLSHPDEFGVVLNGVIDSLDTDAAEMNP